MPRKWNKKFLRKRIESFGQYCFNLIDRQVSLLVLKAVYVCMDFPLLPSDARNVY